MRAIYVVRHAIAEERDADRWPDDAERPLTEAGEESFREAARGLARIVPSVDVVLASPYVRAWRTAEILAEEAGWPAPTRCIELEAWRAPSDAVDVLGEQRGSVALVGHEPYLSRLVSLLLAKDDDAVHIDLKKGGVIHVEDRVLRWYATPKLLRAIR